eukprot:gene20023-7114_t
MEDDESRRDGSSTVGQEDDESGHDVGQASGPSENIDNSGYQRQRKAVKRSADEILAKPERKVYFNAETLPKPANGSKSKRGCHFMVASCAHDANANGSILAETDRAIDGVLTVGLGFLKQNHAYKISLVVMHHDPKAT